MVKGVAPDTNADAILRQAQAIEIATGFRPDAVVMNPQNWNAIVSLKLTDGSYVAGSPFESPASPTLLGDEGRGHARDHGWHGAGRRLQSGEPALLAARHADRYQQLASGLLREKPPRDSGRGKTCVSGL